MNIIYIYMYIYYIETYCSIVYVNVFYWCDNRFMNFSVHIYHIIFTCVYWGTGQESRPPNLRLSAVVLFRTIPQKKKLLKYSTYFRSKWLLYWLIVWAVWAISYPVATGEEEGSQGEAQPRAAIAHMTIICKDVHNVHIYNICIVHILYTVYIYTYHYMYLERLHMHAYTP